MQCSNCGGGSVLASQLGQDIRRALHPGDGHISAPHLGVLGPDAPVVLAGRDSCVEGGKGCADVELGEDGVVLVGDGGVDVVEGGVEVVELCAKAIHCGQGQERNDFDFQTDYTAYRRALRIFREPSGWQAGYQDRTLPGILTFVLTFDAAPLGISHGCPGQHVFLVQVHRVISYMVRAWTSAAVFGPTGEGGGGGAFRLTG